MFSAIPADTGAAFVVIQHLSPDHKSMMASLLGRHTTMPVIMVEDDMVLAPDTVYLIPPGVLMRVEGAHLRLTPKSPRTFTLPIDVFFESVAKSYESRSVGVVLSGTGSDGTRGAAAINEAGGFLIAQEPTSAKFDGMPRSVIATGLVDAILPVEQISERLVSHLASPAGKPAKREEEPVLVPVVGAESAMAGIIQLLVKSTGINFAEYKPGTVIRRIERRMTVRQIATMDAYFILLSQDRIELQTLGRELLIPVTRFFRDAEAFEALRTQVIAPLVSSRASGQEIRVWCAGVSTGEEAYSVAMLFLEAFEQTKRWPGLKIFATDVDQTAIETAGSGIYPSSIAAEVTQEQLDRFFINRGDSFQVKPELRQCIVFARHNLLTDPPFTKMDLVVCRNALIYFRSDAQERVLRRLQYALALNGHMFLGSSESLGSLHTDFRPINARNKIWQVVRPAAGLTIQASNRSMALTPSALSRRPKQAEWSAAPRTPVDIAYNSLLKAYSPPPAILVAGNHQVVHFFGDVRQYLELHEGEASLEISRILPQALVPVAAALLFKLARENSRMVSDLVRLPPSGRDADNTLARYVRLCALPVGEHDGQFHAMLVFEEVMNSPAAEAVEIIDVDRETAERLAALEHELAATRETLQATIEELETSNEELQATNEELMASNEELQSSNEELQSVNEELNTVNTEYQEKLDILNRVNADLESLAKVVASGTVFVDHNLQLTRFSPEAKHIFRLRETDIGRPLSDLNHQLDYPDLISDLHKTLETSHPIERSVRDVAGKFYLVKMLPYRIPSSSARGIVISFIETTSIHRANRLQAVMDALAEHIAVLDNKGEILLVNEAWRQFARENGDPELKACGPGTNYLQVCTVVPDAEDGAYAIRAANGLGQVLNGEIDKFTMEYPCHSPTEKRWFLMHVRRMDGEMAGAVVSHVNITSWLLGTQDRPDAPMFAPVG